MWESSSIIIMSKLRATPPRVHRSRRTYVSDSLNSASHVFIRQDTVRGSLQRPYEGPFKVLQRTAKYFVVDVNGRSDTVSIDRLKPAFMESQYIPIDVPEVIQPSTPLTPLQAMPSNTPQTTRSGRYSRPPVRLDL